MTINWPTDIPSSARISQIRVTPNQFAGLFIATPTGSQQAQEWQGGLWEGEITFQITSEAAAADFEGWVSGQRGVVGTFKLPPALRSNPRGLGASAVASTLQVNGTPSGFDLPTQGWTPSQTGILLRGDYVQHGIGAAARLYQVTEDADSDASGLSTLNVWPRTEISSPADLDTLYVSNVYMCARFSTPVSIDLSVPFFGTITVPFISVVTA